MSTTDTTPDQGHLTRFQIWKRIDPLISEAWSAPISVSIHPNLIAVDVQFQHDDRAAVDGAFAAMQLTVHPKLDLSHTFDAQAPDETRRYGYWGYGAVSPLLPNISLRLWCHLHTRVDASAHWDGPILARPVGDMNLMQVTVRDRDGEAPWGVGLTTPCVRTVEISTACPVCGGPRGVPFGINSCDDGAFYWVQGWENPCGHRDSYAAVLAEAAALQAEASSAATPAVNR